MTSSKYFDDAERFGGAQKQEQTAAAKMTNEDLIKTCDSLNDEIHKVHMNTPEWQAMNARLGEIVIERRYRATIQHVNYDLEAVRNTMYQLQTQLRDYTPALTDVAEDIDKLIAKLKNTREAVLAVKSAR